MTNKHREIVCQDFLFYLAEHNITDVRLMKCLAIIWAGEGKGKA